MSYHRLDHDLKAARATLANLQATKPQGSPWALMEYANALKLEAETLAHAAASQARVPAGLEFEGPAADAFRANADEVAKQIGDRANEILTVAHTVAQAGTALEHAINQWEHHHRNALQKVEDLKRDMARVTR